MKKLILLIGTVSMLGGCSTVFNTEVQAVSAAERHPITVDQQTMSLRIPVDSTLTGLSRESLARLDEFLTAYRTAGYGPVTVTSPTMGKGPDLDGHQTAADVRSALHAFGLAYEDMQGATYRTDHRGSDVLVSFTRYVASGPVCGVFTGEMWSRLRNQPAPNFGCATQANFAAMVADPRDLTERQSLAEANGAGTAATVRSTQVGKDTYSKEIMVVGAPIGGDSE